MDVILNKSLLLENSTLNDEGLGASLLAKSSSESVVQNDPIGHFALTRHFSIVQITVLSSHE